MCIRDRFGSWIDSGEAVGSTVGDGEGGSVGGIFMIADGEASGVTVLSGAGERLSLIHIWSKPGIGKFEG